MDSSPVPTSRSGTGGQSTELLRPQGGAQPWVKDAGGCCPSPACRGQRGWSRGCRAQPVPTAGLGLAASPREGRGEHPHPTGRGGEDRGTHKYLQTPKTRPCLPAPPARQHRQHSPHTHTSQAGGGRQPRTAARPHPADTRILRGRRRCIRGARRDGWARHPPLHSP